MNLTTPIWNESNLCIAIEDFVYSVCFEQMSEQQFKHSLSTLYEAFQHFYSAQLHYAVSIQYFIQCKHLIDHFLNGQPTSQILNFNNQQVSILCCVLYQYQNEYWKEQACFIQQEQQNRNSLYQYLTKLMTHYSKLLFVRVDLGYLEAQQVYVGIQDVQQHMDILRNRIANQDGCFMGLRGYAWALEQGVDKGYHCHLLLIYDPSKRQKDWYLADQVWQMWNSITGNIGVHYNCNTTNHKQRFMRNNRLGVGPIRCSHPVEASNALNAAMYLVNPEKYAQHLRVKIPHMRSFGTGQFEVYWRRGVAQTLQQCEF
ncbi:YagK/YfjJ domain-containing protein [Acinetobacter sp. MD2(2019)]|uniref:YagK/YfjJ domain-containing protein n=1 Tax=Acinetobacter sp. MD2(2019) TaxID=2605273 RepID=UPI002D1F19DE|nr:inovirus-type Gp2 protein [Acinetobacter sp. MD2(2019)]MEB3755023.1 inovirus-type Gp2 protein [Acinetobacter sp. MD2(2019)]